MFVFSLVLIVVLTAVDQIIKFVVNDRIDPGSIIEVIKFGDVKVFSLTHIRNSGAAWSIMEGKTWFLIALPIAVCLIGLVYMYKIRKGSKLELVSLAMLVAGGVGNLIDRIRMSEVIDYIKFEPVNFPIFNFADICVVIGAVLFCVSIFITDVVKEKHQKQAVSSAEKQAENE
ncbi:MAG: signal peptidase II [Ruminococcus sp.]|nr:signal peptidase II [Ruminococcus sp.]